MRLLATIINATCRFGSASRSDSARAIVRLATSATVNSESCFASFFFWSGQRGKGRQEARPPSFNRNRPTGLFSICRSLAVAELVLPTRPILPPDWQSFWLFRRPRSSTSWAPPHPCASPECAESFGRWRPAFSGVSCRGGLSFASKAMFAEILKLVQRHHHWLAGRGGTGRQPRIRRRGTSRFQAPGSVPPP